MTTEKLQQILQSDKALTLNEVKEIIYELKNDCVVFKEDRYEAGFYNGEQNAFYICLDLLDKLDVTKDSLEKRLIKLEAWQERTRIQNKVMSLFANMQYGKLGQKEVDMAYYKMKLNEIFGNNYTDTDSVKQDGYSAKILINDEIHNTLYPNCYACAKCERDVVICQEEGRCMKNGKDTI